MRKAMLFLTVFALAGSLWAADPLIGTWKLNAAKSKARPGASLPKEQTDVCRELDTNQIECVTKSINADGSAGTLTITFPSQGGMVKLQPPSRAQPYLTSSYTFVYPSVLKPIGLGDLVGISISLLTMEYTAASWLPCSFCWRSSCSILRARSLCVANISLSFMNARMIRIFI